MAVEGEELDYESDPEDALLPSAMRRREASDDEEDAEGSDGGDPRRRELRAGIRSDDESDGQGGAYEDEEEFDGEEEDEEEELEDVAEEEGLEDYAETEGRPNREEEGGDLRVERVKAVVDQGSGGDVRSLGGEPLGLEGKIQPEDEEEKEKDENEPFAVPTGGAFYMHDDRFRENIRGRRRRMPGARKSWESKDDRAWVHDRFEEMNLQEARYNEQRRTAKGHLRGHGNNRPRGTNNGYVRGNRSRSYDDNNNQSRAPRSMKGRGPRWYETLPKNNSDIPANQNKQYTKSRESTSSTNAGRPSSHASNVQPDPVIHHKNVFASSLSSASPPFYPSGSSNKDMPISQKRDAQSRHLSKNSMSPQVGNNFSTSQSGSFLRGKAIVDSVGHDRGNKYEYIPPVPGKSSVNSQYQSSGSHSPANHTQPHSRFQGRGSIAVTGAMNHQPAASLNQITQVSVQTQNPVAQQKPVQASMRTSIQKIDQRSGSGSRDLSPSQSPSVNASDGGEIGYPPVASKSNFSLVMGKIGNQGGSNTGSFLYGGAAQVLGATGAMGLAHGDQSFPHTPALLPVMQFGGQHHGGLGVPAVGMAVPGYVAQPQLGFGNSEMTWVPVLAGAAGAFGGSYPYIALDNSFYARNSGPTSSSTSSSGEAGATKTANTLKSPQRLETVNDEFGQRQNKPRRYSEMNFGQ